MVENNPDPGSTLWYKLTQGQALEQLTATSSVLISAQVHERKSQYGSNELETTSGATAWTILFAQFKNVLIIILLIPTVISAMLGHEIKSAAITVIVLFAIILGFVQEYRAGNALKALKRMTAPTAKVLRDGRECDIAARELVPGDIVLLRTGDLIPADLRLIEVVNLQADESSLIGESAPVSKQIAPLDLKKTAGGRSQQYGFLGNSCDLWLRDCSGHSHWHEYRIRSNCRDAAVRPHGQDSIVEKSGQDRSPAEHSRRDDCCISAKWAFAECRPRDDIIYFGYLLRSTIKCF